MEPRTQKAMDGAVQEAVSGLFEAYGYPVVPLGPPDTVDSEKEYSEMAGVIGFCTEQLSGNLVISTSEAVVLSTVPAGVNRPQSSDWLGELSNQLLGRLKNQLRRFGVALQMSTPIVLVGPRLQIFGSAVSGVRAYRFGLAQGQTEPLVIMLDLQAQDDFRLEQVELKEEIIPEGGELFF
jgi:CheY-specific phosphatase CheX